MAKSKTPLTWVTAERASRLVRLLRLLGVGPKSRSALTKKLRLGVRGFYRDLETLREVNISITLTKGLYTLEDDLDEALTRLPFPDPGLNLGEARQLAKGRSSAHRKIREQLARIEK